MTSAGKLVSYWRKLGTGSVNRQIFSAALIIAAATLAVKVIAVVKDSIVVGQFGLGDQLDAFLIALVIPTFATTVIAGSFNASFLPPYIRIKEQEGAEAAKRLFANIMLLDLLVLVIMAFVMMAGALPLLKLIAWEFTGEKLALAHHLYLLLLPVIVLEGQIILWGSVLNAGEKFALVAWAPALSPIIIIVGLITLVPHWGITALACATVVGFAAELAAIGLVLRRRGLLPQPRWYKSAKGTGEVYKNYFPVLFGSVIMSSTVVIDQAMASWLAAGSVTALNYGNKVPSALTGLGVAALGTAVLPYFSKLIAQGDYAAIRHTLRTYVGWILVLSVPATLVLLGFSEWIVKLLFERGSFKADDTALVTDVQRMYLLQIPFFLVGVFCVRLLNALSKNYLVMIICVVNLIVNVVGNLIFMRWFGVSGIALSTSIVYMVSMVLILAFVYRTLMQNDATSPRATQ